MTHEDAVALIAVLKSIEGWGWWICFWVFVAGMAGVLVSIAAVNPGRPLWFGLIALLMLGVVGYYFFEEKRRTLQALQSAFPGSVLCKDAGRGWNPSID